MNNQYKLYVTDKLAKSGFTDIKSVPKSDFIIATSKGGAKVCVCCEYSEFELFAEDITSLAQAKATFGCSAAMMVTNISVSDEIKNIAAVNKVIIKDNVNLPTPPYPTAVSPKTVDNLAEKTNTHVTNPPKKSKESSTNKLIIAFVIIILLFTLIKCMSSDDNTTHSGNNSLGEIQTDSESSTSIPESLENIEKWYIDQTAAVSQSLIEYSKSINGLSYLNVDSSHFRFGEDNGWYDCHYTMYFTCKIDSITYNGEARAF